MTLEALQYLVTDIALKHNLVNCVISGPSIYGINPEDIKEYPLIFISPTGTHTIKENTTRYSLTFFYMDRLFEDSSNEESVSSAGIETLRNLKLQLSKIEVVTDIQDEADIRLFTETERMSDRVAGAYMTIWIETLNPSTCPAFFDEYGFYLGNYFATEGLEAVLDGLASKEWVERLIASISVSGITPEEFERIMGDYVLRNRFATINGTGITNREKYNLVEQGEYNEQVAQIYEAISAATPSDYDSLRTQVSANTENISTINSAVSSNTQNISILSGAQPSVYDFFDWATSGDGGKATLRQAWNADFNAGKRVYLKALTTGGEVIYLNLESTGSTDEFRYASDAYGCDVSINNTNTATGVTGYGLEARVEKEYFLKEEDLSALSAQTSANTAQIETLNDTLSGTNETLVIVSGQTTQNTQDIANLSGSTEQSVSSLTQEIETLSQAISAATPADYDTVKQQVSANTENITALSGVTSGLSSDLQALSAYTENISDWVFYTVGYTSPWDVRNYNDLVDFVKSLGNEAAKARIFINENDRDRYIEYHPFRVSGDTVYLYSVYNTIGQRIKVRYGSYTKNRTPVESDFAYFEYNPYIDTRVSNLEGQVATNTSGITSLDSGLTALSAYTETLSGSAKVYILNAADIYSAATNEERTALWEEAEAKYLSGYTLYLKGRSSTSSSGYDIWLPLVKYQPYDGSTYSGQLDFVAKNGSLIDFWDINFYHRGAIPTKLGNGGVLSTSTIYTLPTASNTGKGGIKVGTGLSMSGDTMNADVASSDVHNIVSLTQSAYDALTTKDANTLYIIKPLY